jgi:hypothetical protein
MRDRDSLILESLYKNILLREDKEDLFELLPPEKNGKYDYPWEILYPKNDEDFKKLENLVNELKKDRELSWKLFNFRATNEEEMEELRNLSADIYERDIPKVMYSWLTNPEYNMSEDQAKKLYEYLKNGVREIRKNGMEEYTRKNLKTFNSPDNFLNKFKAELKQNSKKSNRFV